MEGRRVVHTLTSERGRWVGDWNHGLHPRRSRISLGAPGERHISAGAELAERIAVTGGTGFLGRRVVRELRERGNDDVVALSRDDVDLVDPASTFRFFYEVRPTRVLHLAAAVGGIGANVELPGWFSYANTLMGANVLEAARRTGTTQVLVIGTVCVYPGDAPVPTPETSMFDGFPAAATAPYGVAKRNVWTMAKAYRDQYGLDTSFLIPTNLYGPGDHFEESRSHVVPALIRRCVEAAAEGRESITVWGDGTATRDLLYVGDAARGIADALESYHSIDPVNLGSGRETSIRELVETIAGACGFEGRLDWDPTKPTGAQRRCLATDRARSAFGFRATTTLEEGLRETVAWYLAEAPTE